MSKINNYLPKVLQPIIEFQQINSNLDIELTNIDKLVKGVAKEAIVQTATEYGIKKWENALGIIPGDSESLEVRRFRVNNVLTSKLPYTLRWLESKLTEIVGSDSGWTLSMNYENHTIAIVLSGLDTKLMLEVEKQLRNSIPANMELEIGGPGIASAEIKIGGAMMYATKYLIGSKQTIQKFEFYISEFEVGSIKENGKIDNKDAGVAVTSNFIQVFSNRNYEYGDDQGYSVYGLAFYDMYGNLIERRTGLNVKEFTTPVNAQLVRVTIMDERGIRETDITGAYILHI